MKKYSFILSLSLLFFGFLFFNVSTVHAAPLPPRTLYYNNATLDYDWGNLLNWWDDTSFSVQALALPTSIDDVIISGSISSNSMPPASVNAMTVNGTAYVNTIVTVATLATFNDSSILINSFSTIPNAIFNNSSVNLGTVSGYATFNDSSNNNSVVSGNAIFNDLSWNNSEVDGDATFNFNYARGGTFTLSGTQEWEIVLGTVRGIDGVAINKFIFNDSSINHFGTVPGNAIFNDSSFNSVFGTVTGDATFNDSSHNNNVVSGDAFFYGSSYNATSCGFFCIPTISGNATFNDSSFNHGLVAGLVGPINASFNDSSSNASGTVTNAACFASTANPTHGTVGSTYPGGCPVSIPTVTTNSATVQTTSSADLFGAITDTGGESANTVGFQYYAQNSSNTTYSDTISTPGTFVRQAFDKVASSLSVCGLYHYRAFATNSAGTGYGGDLTFTANACPTGGGGGPITPPVIPPPPIVPPVTPPSIVSPVLSTPLCTITKTLRAGMRGCDVLELHKKMAALGYYSSFVDDSFGRILKAAVIKFQLTNKLVGDGIVGPLTRAVLNK